MQILWKLKVILFLINLEDLHVLSLWPCTLVEMMAQVCTSYSKGQAAASTHVNEGASLMISVSLLQKQPASASRRHFHHFFPLWWTTVAFTLGVGGTATVEKFSSGSVTVWLNVTGNKPPPVPSPDSGSQQPALDTHNSAPKAAAAVARWSYSGCLATETSLFQSCLGVISVTTSFIMTVIGCVL